MSAGLYPQVPLLLVDDEQAWLDSFAFTLEYEAGISNVILCRDSRQVATILEQREVSLVLLDQSMPYLSGKEVLGQIKQAHPELPIIMLSGINELESAVACMKSGAHDYFIKANEKERLYASIKSILSIAELQRECDSLKESLLHEKLQCPEAFTPFRTQNARMKTLFRYVEAVSSSREPVLITGESGSGKELIAEALHTVCHRSAPLIAVNVAGLDDAIFADTLFGHVRGAFTNADAAREGLIAKAQGGTLFLDEIGDLSQQSQLKLLRVIQDKSYFPIGADRPRMTDARIVVATNKDLVQEVEKGEFRRDLYYRLRTHHIHLPPLRERSEDIPLLVEDFIDEAARSLGKRRPSISAEALRLLARHPFPGNIRELRGLIFDALSRHRGKELSAADFEGAFSEQEPRQRTSAVGRTGAQEEPVIPFPYPLPTLAEATKQLVLEAMERAGGTQSVAARMLGISPQALSKRLKKMDDLKG